MPTVEKHYFQKINTDLEDRFMQSGMYRYLMNGIVGSSSADNLGSVENPVGTVSIKKVGGSFNGPLNTPSNCIKIFNDKETNTLIIFIYEPIVTPTPEVQAAHSIWRYTPKNNQFDKILEWEGLNFDISNKISGITIIDGQLIFTDNLNEYRKINIQKGIDGLYSPATSELTSTFLNVENFNGVAVFVTADGINIPEQFPSNTIINVTVTSGSQPSGQLIVNLALFIDNKTKIYTSDPFVSDSSGEITYETSDQSIVKEEDITLLRRGPRYPLTTIRTEDDTVIGNRLGRNSFQFTYRYIYWDNEYSVVAPLSKISLIASRDDIDLRNDNNIICSIPDLEETRRTVKKIEWIFRIDNTNEYSIFKLTGPSTRSVSFRNNVAGATLSDAEVLKSFDDVPIFGSGLRSLKGFVFLNNYVSGYDTVKVNLVATLDEITSTNYTNETLYRRRIDETPFSPGPPISPPAITTTTYEYYWWKLGGRWYKVTIFFNFIGGVSNASFIVNPNQGNGLPDSSLSDNSFIDGEFTTWHYYYPTVTISGITIIYNPSEIGRFFKTGDTIQIGLKYIDSLGRNIGVSTNDAARITIPDVSNPKEDFSVSNGTISWNLSNDSEIPLWATHYEIVRTRNLSRSFFLQGIAGIMIFGIESTAVDGTKELKLVNNWDPAAKLYFHIENSIKYKIGYVFSSGDRLRFYLNGIPLGEWYDAKIVSQEGPWIVTDNVLNGILGTTTQALDVFYEIYTPYLGSLEESFFEIGETFEINNPGTSSRSYSVKTGQLDGDIVRKTRNIHSIIYDDAVFDPIDNLYVPLNATPESFIFEAMNPNDDYYEQWVSDIGRPTFIVEASKQKNQKFKLKWSGEFSIDSLRNMISSFSPFDEYDMPIESGPAASLAITGNNLLFLHEQETSSVYIREGYLSNQESNGSLIRLVETVSDDRKLALGHGCINPESVAEYEDKVWYWDMFKGSVVEYTNQGLIPISDDGMINHFYDLSRKLIPFKDEIKVYGHIDPYHKYYILTFEANTNANYEGETFAFNINRGGGGVGWFSFKPEMYGSINKTLFSFYKGKLYSHNNEDACNNFYNQGNVPRVLKFVGNQEGSKVKIWANFRIDAESITVDMDSSDVVIRLKNDQGQEGRVLAHQVEKREGVYIGPLRQDVLTPNSNNLAFNGDAEKELYFMYNGDVLRSQVCEVEVTNDRRDLSPLYFVNLLYRISEASFN